MCQAANLPILTAFQNSIKIFFSNWDDSLVSFSKDIVSCTFALTGIKYGRWHESKVLYFKDL